MELFLEGIQNIRKGRTDVGFLELYRWYQKDGQRKKQLECLLQVAFYENPQTGIGRAVAKALYGGVLENSATRLEQFAACAFAHFLQYVVWFCRRTASGAVRGKQKRPGQEIPSAGKCHL